MKPVLEQNIALVLVFARYKSPYFKFIAAFPGWTETHNQQYVENMVHSYGRENVRVRMTLRKGVESTIPTGTVG
jgi:hypothetical protein